MNTQALKQMKQQQGFTLIELMIVVAIIGILAAIAIPAYQNYVLKSQLSGAYSEVSSLKTGVTNYLLTHTLADLSGEADAAKAVGWTGASQFSSSGPTITAAAVGADPDGDGTGATSATVTISMNLDQNVSSQIGASGNVTLTRTDGQWTCKFTTATVPADELPGTCTA